MITTILDLKYWLMKQLATNGINGIVREAAIQTDIDAIKVVALYIFTFETPFLYKYKNIKSP